MLVFLFDHLQDSKTAIVQKKLADRSIYFLKKRD